MSHPTWVRGLKQYEAGKEYKSGKVAPHVGAWIETKLGLGSQTGCGVSHPTWVRGLKP